MDTETIIASFSYFGIFALMVSNGFVSFPSSQVLYIIAGYFISTGKLSLPLVIVVGTIGNTIGNIILYEIARSKGLAYLTKIPSFPERELRKVEEVFKKKGARFLIIGKLIPALKVFVPIPAGLAKMDRALYVTIIVITSAIWTLPFISIGYIFGKSTRTLGSYAVVLTIIAFVVVAFFYRSMNSKEIVSEIEK